MNDSFNSRSVIKIGDSQYEIFSLKAINNKKIEKLPYSHKILLENLLRNENGIDVTKKDIEALSNWDASGQSDTEISFSPARVILQDFTGVPAIVDLAAMRDAVVKLGGLPEMINPLSPAELVIDHSVQVDSYGTIDALKNNNEIEFNRNKERYSFLKWGQNSFKNFHVVPPNTGIVHQVNLEYLSRIIFNKKNGNDSISTLYPDTVIGTDSHTTMINGLGILGWGVGGIEAEAAMLGQAITMLIPQVVGLKLTGKLKEGTTATDLVLTVTEILRKHGVVGKFVEFFGDGLNELPLADRATLGNMSPEFGSTCAIFPIDKETIRYLELSGRSKNHIKLIEIYAKEQGLWRYDGKDTAKYSETLELDMRSIEPSIAGPKRPQDRIELSEAHTSFRKILTSIRKKQKSEDIEIDNVKFTLRDGSVLIAAITSCTNTSNPTVMVAAGLLARNARKRGITSQPWVKTSLAPGSKVVTDYLKKANLLDDLESLGFYNVGYGCTTCIGNSGPLKKEISDAITKENIIGCSVLSGNRNFEGRIHPQTQMSFLASPPIVVAYALSGNLDFDFFNHSLGEDQDGQDIFLSEIWPTQKEIQEIISRNINSDMFKSNYKNVFDGDENWNGLDVETGDIFSWNPKSTYVKHPPYFENMSLEKPLLNDIHNARVLAFLGDSVTTDHISPAGSISTNSPAAEYLKKEGVEPKDFNSYGSRRGNHEIMMRGTFANNRLRNKLVPDTEGGWTLHTPTNKKMTIYDASQQYKQENIPLIIIAGKEYGAGSSRDWAAKGPLLLGVKAVLASSYERIHRSNLIGMGILPLEFIDNEEPESLGLNGTETYSITAFSDTTSKFVNIEAKKSENTINFKAKIRIDTPKERDYFEHGGILHYVLRQLVNKQA